MYYNLYNLIDLESGDVILHSARCREVAKKINELEPEAKIRTDKFTYYALNRYVIKERFMVNIVGRESANHHSEEGDKEMIRLYRAGESASSLSKKFGCTTRYITKILKANNVPVRNLADYYQSLEKSVKRSKEIKELYPDKKINDLGKLSALAKAGWKLSEIAVEFGTNTQEVEKCLKALKKKSDFSCTTSI